MSIYHLSRSEAPRYANRPIILNETAYISRELLLEVVGPLLKDSQKVNQIIKNNSDIKSTKPITDMSEEWLWSWGVGLVNENELLFTLKEFKNTEQKVSLYISNDKKELLLKSIKFEEITKGIYYTTTYFTDTIKGLLNLDINIPMFFMTKYKQ